ncbi:hypothetical protein [Nocardia wallacei]|uniref:hypothetical protein n=1 Tax=Nocardia wallacei TaxID=480035 RepID=UPI0024585AEB|nr:hypothetical protein [Nocardia wallacei]
MTVQIDNITEVVTLPVSAVLESGDELHRFSVQMKPHERLSVVVIEENCEIGFAVAIGDPGRIDILGQNGTHDMESVQLFLRDDDIVVLFRNG